MLLVVKIVRAAFSLARKCPCLHVPPAITVNPHVSQSQASNRKTANLAYKVHIPSVLEPSVLEPQHNHVDIY